MAQHAVQKCACSYTLTTKVSLPCQRGNYTAPKIGYMSCFVTVSATASAYTPAGFTFWHGHCGVVFMGAGDMAT